MRRTCVVSRRIQSGRVGLCGCRPLRRDRVSDGQTGVLNDTYELLSQATTGPNIQSPGSLETYSRL